jgi:hypothetical protein
MLEKDLILQDCLCTAFSFMYKCSEYFVHFSEEIIRFSLAFHLIQFLEGLHTPIPSLRITSVCLIVNAPVKISVDKIGSPRGFGNNFMCDARATLSSHFTKYWMSYKFASLWGKRNMRFWSLIRSSHHKDPLSWTPTPRRTSPEWVHFYNQVHICSIKLKKKKKKQNKKD